MKRMKLGNELDVPVIGLGCMRIWDKPISEVERLIATSLELGSTSSTTQTSTAEGNLKKYLLKH